MFKEGNGHMGCLTLKHFQVAEVLPLNGGKVIKIFHILGKRKL